MAGLVNGGRSTYIYNSDDGKSYLVEMDTNKALAGGFGIGPASGGQKGVRMKMRGVWGVVKGSGSGDSAPGRTFLPIASKDNSLFTGSTTTFSLTYPGNTYTYSVTGIKGERRQHLGSA